MTVDESTFVAPEGVYALAEEIRPPSIAHLPSSAPILFPARLSTVVIRFPPPKQLATPGLSSLLGGKEREKRSKRDEKGTAKDKRPANDDHSVSSNENVEEGGATVDPANPDHLPPSNNIHDHDGNLNGGHPPPPPIPPTPLFSPLSSALTGKKKSISRPKHNIRTTSSSFITRIHTIEGMSKLLSSKQGSDVTFLFYNAAKNFYWNELGSKLKDPFSRITFSAYPTCHDVNIFSSSHACIDVVIGFNTGDLVWFDPLNSRYVRLNKGGCISPSPCTSIKWVPQSKTLFLVSHADGTMIVYDIEREDGSSFKPRDPGPSSTSGTADSNSGSAEGSALPGWNPLEEMLVTSGTGGGNNGEGGGSVGGMGTLGSREKAGKNPVSHWRVSDRNIVAFAFSPEVRYVAVVAEDSCLRVIDALTETLLDTYASYFGSLTCISWSPDGRFILTGGQDDLVTVYSPSDHRVVARCQGHSSFISGVAFDPNRCDGRTYRFGSVGEDNKLILWDFSSGALHRPKAYGHQNRFPVTSTVSLVRHRSENSDRSTAHLLGTPGGTPGPQSHYHPAPPRNEVALLQPVLIKPIDGDILTSVFFMSASVLTISKGCVIKVWTRPLPVRPRGKGTEKGDDAGTSRVRELIR
ncbi:hypothetical protein BOTBODRAFT_149285 [Botryobasidium botryosum FD-172 SS1]|uniref:Uncharacterized protein n=1 Tax=Botryobasidium botryosum (strain FD-172 SS1) TaxID=930990 RepID=A0A067LVQ5_BOTB1|nr:hypothetical protein BOTBODRAFT_149285 [Botryobasidium botryosum FD-172 SS1]